MGSRGRRVFSATLWMPIDPAVERARAEEGFGLVELLIAMAVLSIGLLAIVSAFTSGTFAITRAAKKSTASFLADQAMETYRAMVSRDIAIDTSNSVVINALDSTYKNDQACANSTTATTCAANGVAATETGPTGTSPDSCATVNGWYPNTLPCTPSRTLSGSSAPDGRSYRVDVYVIQLASSTGTLPQRTRKQVTVVVRDGLALSSVLARETSVFDCSTGLVPNSTDC